MANELKLTVAEMVRLKVHMLQGTPVSWPEHSATGFGRVNAGVSVIQFRDIPGEPTETAILVKTPAGTRWFKVKVTEMLG